MRVCKVCRQGPGATGEARADTAKDLLAKDTSEEASTLRQRGGGDIDAHLQLNHSMRGGPRDKPCPAPPAVVTHEVPEKSYPGGQLSAQVRTCRCRMFSVDARGRTCL